MNSSKCVLLCFIPPNYGHTKKVEMLSKRFRCKVCMIVFTIVFISTTTAVQYSSTAAVAHTHTNTRHTKRNDIIQKFLVENFLIIVVTRT